MNWIKFKDQEPPRSEQVLVVKQYLDAPYDENGYQDSKYFWTDPFVSIDTYNNGWRNSGRVIYWMPLPQIPDGKHDN